MSALVHKIRSSFSDLWLEIGLFFGRIFRRHHKVAEEPVPPKPSPAASTPLSASPPMVSPVAPPELQSISLSAPVVATAPAPVLSPSPLPPLSQVNPVVTSVLVKPTPLIKPATKEAKKEKNKLPLSLRLLRFSAKERLFFFEEMATLIGSGVTLMDSLNLVRAQTKGKTMRRLYAEMMRHLNGGMTLAETLQTFPHLFPSIQIALIEAGEKSGNLKTVLLEIVRDMEEEQDFLRKIKGAMFYPALLLLMAVTLVTGMMIFVIPRIAKMYKEAKVELPRLTQTVIDMSNFIQAQWKWLLLGLAVGFLLLWLLGKTRWGKWVYEILFGVLPFFGRLAKEKSLMVIASTMAMLLKSGVLISEAFEITQKTIGSLHYQKALERVRHEVTMGKSVSETMGLSNLQSEKFKEDRLFPLAFAQLVRIGETTGTLSEMLAKLRQNYHKAIDYKLKNISTIIEPLMILVVAALVGTILLAVMLPFFYIGTTIK